MPVYFPVFAGTKLYCLVTEAAVPQGSLKFEILGLNLAILTVKTVSRSVTCQL